jgi:CRP/FNR family transcriptional regulator, cyclic AMP receptor protein
MTRRPQLSWQGVDHEEKVSALRSNEMFSVLDDRSIELLAEVAQEVTYKKGETIIVQGEIGTQMFVVVRGSVKIYLRNSSGAIMELCRRNKGEMFGELALLDGGKRTATVDAISSTVLLAISRELFIGIIEREPQTVDGLLRWLGRMVKETSTLNADLVFLDVRERIVRRILQLTHDAKADLIWTQRVTQTELAQMVGSSRQTANVALASLEHDHLISVDVDGIRILDADRLRSLVS